METTRDSVLRQAAVDQPPIASLDAGRSASQQITAVGADLTRATSR
jgi:hypothetical protein